MLVRLAACLLLASSLGAQSVRIYSEFRRVDKSGEILAQDQGGKPREILSPGLVRNAWHSFRVVITMPPGQWYALHIAQNPEEVALVKLYREKNGDDLEPVKLPVQAKGDGSYESFWLDVWLPALLDLKRFRLEAQLHDGSGWIIAPMEVRPLAGILPELKVADAQLPASSAPADATAHATLRSYVCGEAIKAAPSIRNVRSLQRRNAMQDVAIAQMLEKERSKEQMALSIVQAAGGKDVASWCAAGRPDSARLYGPEWYLRVRDYLYREVSR
jgi:hypothetical protein